MASGACDENIVDPACAGVKDSALTVHGTLQAERLGKHLAGHGYRFGHIYSSDLQRAFKTATAIKLAQQADDVHEPEGYICAQVTALPLLREQDFGFYEGKPFYARSKDSKKSGKDSHRMVHQNDVSFQDVESKDSMALRANSFLQEHLLPIISKEGIQDSLDIAVISHGIFLAQIWRKFLQHLPKNSLALSPDVTPEGGGPMSLEYLGGWSNTGYLELELLPSVMRSERSKSQSGAIFPVLSADTNDHVGTSDSSKVLENIQVLIKAINAKVHLHGLKRTRGVSSSKHDEGQKTLDSFFKKKRL